MKVNEGEKSTKYFLNLEKRHHKQGTISQLKQAEESFVTTDKEILCQCETFYRELYRSKIDTRDDKYDHIFFGESIHKKLNQDEKDVCEGPLTKEECLKALNEMECNKTPGSDGLPAEFYRIFWNDISDSLLNSFLEPRNPPPLLFLTVILSQQECNELSIPEILRFVLCLQ